MVVFTIPTVLNKQAQVPRKTSSIPLAICLSVYVPLFWLQGLEFTALTVGGQAVTWWLIVVFRNVKTTIKRPQGEAMLAPEFPEDVVETGLKTYEMLSDVAKIGFKSALGNCRCHVCMDTLARVRNAEQGWISN